MIKESYGNRHGHIFLDFREFYRILHFLDLHIHATFTQKLRVHTTSTRGVDMDTGVYLVRVYVHLTLLCI